MKKDNETKALALYNDFFRVKTDKGEEIILDNLKKLGYSIIDEDYDKRTVTLVGPDGPVVGTTRVYDKKYFVYCIDNNGNDACLCFTTLAKASLEYWNICKKTKFNVELILDKDDGIVIIRERGRLK